MGRALSLLSSACSTRSASIAPTASGRCCSRFRRKSRRWRAVIEQSASGSSSKSLSHMLTSVTCRYSARFIGTRLECQSSSEYAYATHTPRMRYTYAAHTGEVPVL